MGTVTSVVTTWIGDHHIDGDRYECCHHMDGDRYECGHHMDGDRYVLGSAATPRFLWSQILCRLYKSPSCETVTEVYTQAKRSPTHVNDRVVCTKNMKESESTRVQGTATYKSDQ